MDLFLVYIRDRDGWTKVGQGCRFACNGWVAFTYNGAIGRPYLYDDLEQFKSTHLSNPCIRMEWQTQ